MILCKTLSRVLALARDGLKGFPVMRKSVFAPALLLESQLRSVCVLIWSDVEFRSSVVQPYVPVRLSPQALSLGATGDPPREL